MDTSAVVSVSGLCKIFEITRPTRVSLTGDVTSPADFIQIFLRRLTGSITSVQITALESVTFEIGQGEIVGVFGPNGTGKTTLLKILGGLLWPTKGTVLILGNDTRRSRAEVLRLTNYVGGSLTGGAWVDPNLSARRNLLSFGRLFGVSTKSVDNVIGQLGLSEFADQRIGTFSSGMAARLLIAVALVRDARVLLLDEPTVGISPELGREFLTYLRSLAKERCVTILYATHLLGEAEKLCDRVLILRKGRLIADGTIEGLAHSLGLHEHIVISVRCPKDEDLLRTVGSMDGVQELTVKQETQHNSVEPVHTLYLGTDRAQLVFPEAINWLVKGIGATILSARVQVPTLTDIYFHALGEER